MPDGECAIFVRVRDERAGHEAIAGDGGDRIQDALIVHAAAQVRGVLRVEAPKVQSFVLHGTLPVRAGTFPRADGKLPFQVRDSDGTLVPTQVQTVSRFASTKSGADVVEVVARVQAPAGAQPGTPLAYQVVRRLPRAWPPVLGLLGAVLVAVVVTAGPRVLEPMQFRTEPLPGGPTRAEVERIVERSGTPVEEIVVADASRRTTKHNAYVSGLGSTRRIVLYDNLVERRPPAEVGLVLAHELGHHLHGDLPRGILGAGAAIVALCYLLAAVARAATRRGRIEGAADPRGAVLALVVVVVLNVATQPVHMWVSRRAEAAADYAALQLTADPDTYLATKEQLARANLSDPAPPRWTYVLWASHPSPGERLTMGERWPFDE